MRKYLCQTSRTERLHRAFFERVFQVSPTLPLQPRGSVVMAPERALSDRRGPAQLLEDDMRG